MEEGRKLKVFSTEKLFELKQFINDNDIPQSDILVCQYAKNSWVLLYYYTA